MITTRPARGPAGAVLVCALVSVFVGALAGCGLRPSALVPLPGREGVGEGAFTITVELANSQNLVRDGEVKVDDVTVGNIHDIRFRDWHAELVVGLNPGTRLPANAVARLAQKSLLGAEYLELAPPTDQPPTGQLRTGDVIPVARTGRYPETEEVLAALSVVLNGGGLAQLKTITTELNAALSGRQGDVRQLIGTLGTFIGNLDAQRESIVRAIDGIDRLATRLNEQDATLAHAIDTIPGGLEVLNDERGHLVDALGALSDLGDVATKVIDSSHDDLVANLDALRPALGRLADAGKNLTQSLSIVPSYPFPAERMFPSVLKGDYGNLAVTADLNPQILALNFGLGFNLPGSALLSGLPPLGAGQGSGNPLTLPFVNSPGSPLPAPNVLPVPGPLGGSGGLGGSGARPGLPGRDRGDGAGSSGAHSPGGGLLGPIVGGG